MNRTSSSFSIQHTEVCKQQMLSWVNRFNICCFLDNHLYHSPHQSVECIAAAGAINTFQIPGRRLDEIDTFINTQNDWWFGHFGYDLRNEIASQTSSHPDRVGFPDLFLFQPETVLQLNGNLLVISSIHKDPADIYREICSEPGATQPPLTAIRMQQRIPKEQYIETIAKLRQHILRGDCYEINFCQEFYAEDTTIHALQVYRQLTALSPTPFASFYKLYDKYVLCASPERYLRKKGNQLLSQPIKGTLKRNPLDADADALLKTQLRESEKDKSENVMVVDLVRNDLSKVCEEGSVQVEELFGIYSFPQVHQMISTITGILKEGTGLAEILSASFPMGSMTGAPKHRVMELVEQYETTRRGIYSGSIGYITPGGDFDFNVVIRSILYNETNRYLCFLVGGGITFYSDPEKEYEECLVKAEAMMKVLGGDPANAGR